MTTTHAPRNQQLPGVQAPPCLARPDNRPCPRARVARVVLQLAARRVGVELLQADGITLAGLRPTPGRPAITVVRPRDLLERIAHDPKIGVGEA